MFYLKLFVLSMVLFFALDLLWLGCFAKDLYLKSYGTWLRIENGQLLPLWWAALLVYALFSVSILLFVHPLANGHLTHAFLYGAGMGFVIYGVYDFTCLAILKDWPVTMAFIDWAWGTLLYGLVGLSSLYLVRFF